MTRRLRADDDSRNDEQIDGLLDAALGPVRATYGRESVRLLSLAAFCDEEVAGAGEKLFDQLKRKGEATFLRSTEAIVNVDDRDKVIDWLKRHHGLPADTTDVLFASLIEPTQGDLLSVLAIRYSDNDDNHNTIDTYIQALRPCLALVTHILHSQRLAREENHFLAVQASIVRLSRFAEGDLPAKEMQDLQGNLPPLGVASVFALGAQIMLDVFREQSASTCIVFDSTNVRFVRTTDDRSGSSGEEDGMQSRSSKRKSTLGREDTQEEFVMKGSRSDSNISSSNVDASISQHAADPEVHFVASSKGMGGISASANTATTATATGTGTTKGEASEEGISSFDSVSDFLASNNSTLCRYIALPFPVNVLACAGMTAAEERAVAALNGNQVRRIMAGYFASARQSRHGAQLTMEAGERGESELRIRQLLGRDEESGAILCAACIDANLQPSFFMVITFDDVPHIAHRQRMLVEQVGITMSHALLRKRAKAVDHAQQLFIQKVQHELRTPLHAIIGMNEASRYSINAARQDLASVWGRATNDASPISLFIELDDLSESIAESADRLSTLIDDLVDFSLVQSEENRIKLQGQTDKREHVDDEFSTGEGTSKRKRSDRISFATIMSVIDHSIERFQAYFRRRTGDGKHPKVPPPELIVCLDQMDSNESPSHLFVSLDIDCLRRVLWKLVANAVAFTNVGLVRIGISYITNNVDARVKGKKRTDGQIPISQKLKIAIQDTGSGMSPEFVHHRLFQAYQQENPEGTDLVFP